MIKKLGRKIPGVVKFVGRTNFHKSTMVGVELVRPNSMNKETVSSCLQDSCDTRFMHRLNLLAKPMALWIMFRKFRLTRSCFGNSTRVYVKYAT